MTKYYIVNQLLSTVGASMSVGDYIAAAKRIGYTRHQALGSIGGAVNGKTVVVTAGVARRI